MSAITAIFHTLPRDLLLAFSFLVQQVFAFTLTFRESNDKPTITFINAVNTIFRL